jgi:hypothetical protein
MKPVNKFCALNDGLNGVRSSAASNATAAVPFVTPTRISCHAALDMFLWAPSI